MTTSITDFPIENPNFSLTNWVEIIIINSLCSSSPRNQFDMIRTPDNKRLKEVIFPLFKINSEDYKVFIFNKYFKEVGFDVIVEYKKRYFVINNSIDCDYDKIFSAVLTNFGPRIFGTAYQNGSTQKALIEMPSRNAVFR
jgi:hypothetical protein